MWTDVRWQYMRGAHPTFLYESLWNLLGFALLVQIARRWRKFDGQMFLSYFAWYGVGRGFIEGLRTDSLYLFGTSIRASQLFVLFDSGRRHRAAGGQPGLPQP